jgi:hypothetical protein
MARSWPGEVDGDGDDDDEVDGDGFGGTSPSWQGAGTETSISRISSVAAAKLRNFFSKNTDRFRVSALEDFK